jgi:acyl-CoA synthetase
VFHRSKFAVTPKDVILQAAPPSFDPSVVEIFLAIASGATLLMIPGSVKSSPVQVAHVLSSDPQPTIIQATPSFISSLGLRRIQTLLLGKNSVLRILALGGEQCPSITTLGKWKSDGNTTSIFNLYGVTEVSCWSTCHQVKFFKDSEIQEEQVCLGEPFPFCKLQVRDKQGCPVTCGEGQLFVCE